MKNLWIPTAMALSLALAGGCKRQEAAPSATRTTSATEQARTTSTLSTEDNEFMTKAAQGSMLEVDLGREIAAKAPSPDVRAFGKRMETDHGAALAELKQVAEKKGVALPAELDHEHKTQLDKFSKLAGQKLDKEYADDMVDDHEEDVKEFKKASIETKDPDLRAWAAKTLPVLEKHLELAKELKGKTKG